MNAWNPKSRDLNNESVISSRWWIRDSVSISVHKVLYVTVCLVARKAKRVYFVVDGGKRGLDASYAF